MAYRFIYFGVISALISLPATGYADELATSSDPISESYNSGLEDLSLRRDIAGVSHFYFIQPRVPADPRSDIASDALPSNTEGGSAGGYVSFGSPPTSTFLGSNSDENSDTWIDGVAFGVGWRPDVSDSENQNFRRAGRSFSGSEIDRVGLRADLTALLYDETARDAGSTAWRVTGMLGSTSLSLLSDNGGLDLESSGNGGLLWDIGIGWSSGAMSVNAGYQSAYSLNETGEEESSIAVLSLGADYNILPGLSVYGEFNMIDRPLDYNEDGLGAVIILGTGVSF
jgi:hypothetical protein